MFVADILIYEFSENWTFQNIIQSTRRPSSTAVPGQLMKGPGSRVTGDAEINRITQFDRVPAFD